MVVRSLGTVECVDAGEAHIAARSVGFVGRAMSAASAGCVVRRCSWLTTLWTGLTGGWVLGGLGGLAHRGAWGRAGCDWRCD